MIARRGLLIRFGALSGCRVGIRRFFRGIGGRGVSLLLGGLLRLAGVALALIALLLGLGPERRRTRKQEQCGEQSEIQHSPFILQGISSTRDGCASMPEELIQRATGRKGRWHPVERRRASDTGWAHDVEGERGSQYGRRPASLPVRAGPCSISESGS